jgi:hypothetical protein
LESHADFDACEERVSAPGAGNALTKSGLAAKAIIFSSLETGGRLLGLTYFALNVYRLSERLNRNATPAGAKDTSTAKY